MDQSLDNMNRAAGMQDARETAEIYLRAVELLHSWEDNNPLEMWEKPEFALSSSDGRVTAIDESKIPPDQLEAFLEAKQRQLELKRESESAAVKLAIEASARRRAILTSTLASSPPHLGGRLLISIPYTEI